MSKMMEKFTFLLGLKKISVLAEKDGGTNKFHILNYSVFIKVKYILILQLTFNTF